MKKSQAVFFGLTSILIIGAGIVLLVDPKATDIKDDDHKAKRDKNALAITAICIGATGAILTIGKALKK